MGGQVVELLAQPLAPHLEGDEMPLGAQALRGGDDLRQVVALAVEDEGQPPGWIGDARRRAPGGWR